MMGLWYGDTVVELESNGACGEIQVRWVGNYTKKYWEKKSLLYGPVSDEAEMMGYLVL